MYAGAPHRKQDHPRRRARDVDHQEQHRHGGKDSEMGRLDGAYGRVDVGVEARMASAFSMASTTPARITVMRNAVVLGKRKP